MLSPGEVALARRRRRAGLVAASCCFLLVACDPPGKPGPPEVASENITDFNILYGLNCSGCHGAEGKNAPGRQLNNALYLKLIPKDQLRHVIEYGRPGTQMPAWAKSQGGPLTDQQLTALVDGIENAWAKSFKAPANAPLPAYVAEGAAVDVSHGKKLFLRACFMCHGKGAPIGPVTDPNYLSLVSDQYLRTSIIAGRSDLGMPDYRTLNLGHALSDSDVSDLVGYLASLRPANYVPEGAHTVENGTGQGQITKGNEGSGNGPGSPERRPDEGNKFNSGQSQGGSPVQGKTK